jgi:hypothetical protein
MRNIRRLFSLVLFIFVTTTVSAQEPIRPLTKRVFVKTNVLSLLAKRPTFSVEKAFSKTFSTEVSFVQGQFNNFLLTDHYDYKGLLIRAKKYFIGLDYGAVSPYVAVYAGNLKRHIQTTGQVDNTGFWGYPDRNFSANSIRGGGSLGFAYFTKSKFVLDGQGSLGYGRYLNIDKSDPDTYFKGYLDVQVWLSIGYCF